MKPIFLTEGLLCIENNINKNLAYLHPSGCDYEIDYFTAQKHLIESKLFLYIQTLLKELIKRLPNNINVFKNIYCFSPSFCLSPSRRINFCERPFINILAKNNLDILETQYNALLSVNWTEIIEEYVLNDSYKFSNKFLFFNVITFLHLFICDNFLCKISDFINNFFNLFACVHFIPIVNSFQYFSSIHHS